MLHFAPETALAEQFMKSFDYLSADLDGSQAMASMNIMDLDLPDESVDSIVCNHVLEHVPNDSKALSELYRVMSPGGWGSIQVPMIGETTVEGDSTMTAEEKMTRFGQEDHERQYGRDYLKRLEAHGFRVLVVTRDEVVGEDDVSRLSLHCEREVVLVRKRMNFWIDA